MHPPRTKERALHLIAGGHSDQAISRRTGLPRTTIRDWRRAVRARNRDALPEICPRCWRATRPIRLSDGDYAELLAMYFGDGYVSIGPRSQRLRLTLDLRYPGIIRSTRELLGRCFPANKIHTVGSGTGNWVNVSVYSSHLVCLFPQHGAGRKHERRISLEPWQQACVSRAPWTFLRGLIATDGCSFINRTGPYEYLSYGFANRSEDIARLFAAACDRAGVRYRLTGPNGSALWAVRINRRESVAKMVARVGLKA